MDVIFVVFFNIKICLKMIFLQLKVIGFLRNKKWTTQKYLKEQKIQPKTLDLSFLIFDVYKAHLSHFHRPASSPPSAAAGAAAAGIADVDVGTHVLAKTRK